MSIQVRLSYEEQILNAMNRVGNPKRKPPESNLDYQKRQFDAIREVLNPMYEENKALKGGGSAEQMAYHYASMLFERLSQVDPDINTRHLRADDDTTSTKHLLWMCKEIMDHTGYVPKSWSVTKLHRWIGYIQGVMTARRLTTVLQERNDYRELKTKVLNELGLSPEQDV